MTIKRRNAMCISAYVNSKVICLLGCIIVIQVQWYGNDILTMHLNLNKQIYEPHLRWGQICGLQRSDKNQLI